MEVHGGPSTRKRRKPPDPFWLHFLTEEEKEKQRIAYWQAVPISNVGLSVRIANTLENHGIYTIGDLARITADELVKIPNLGEITIRHCRQLLKDLKLTGLINEPGIGSRSNGCAPSVQTPADRPTDEGSAGSPRGSGG